VMVFKFSLKFNILNVDDFSSHVIFVYKSGVTY
jgi:hypothetical protein